MPQESPFAEIDGRDLVLLSTDPRDSGTHEIIVVVSLADHPDETPVKLKYSLKIIACEVTGLLDPSETLISPFNQIFGLPAEGILAMPLYEPVPLCGYSGADVTYKLATVQDKAIPGWLKINPSAH